MQKSRNVNKTNPKSIKKLIKTQDNVQRSILTRTSNIDYLLRLT